MKCDFSGYATKNDLKCSDGRVIRQGAFRTNDGSTVPLVWAHMHDSPSNILGHAQLENRDDGVYAYCTFNNTEKAKTAKELVAHGDVNSMSIYANQLKQLGEDVLHGVIREVSLVLAGANPGAVIENVSFAHMDGSSYDSEEDIFLKSNIVIDYVAHSEDKTETIAHADSENQNGSSNSDSGSDSDPDDDTIEDVINSMNEKQKNVLYYLVGSADEDADDEDDDEMAQSGMEGDAIMHHNVFDGTAGDDIVLTHSDLNEILTDAKNNKADSLQSALHAAFIAHGIDDIELLFPEAKMASPTPDMITRRMEWVSSVWSRTKKQPYSRIKSMAADLTEDDARARGYIKGNQKVEEQFSLLKRVTTPQTVYKKQSLDRDDVIDITDFDVVMWLKQEMRMMLDEELARAILVGDGRSITSPDKIKTDNIRPIYQDDDLYTIHHTANKTSDMDVNEYSNFLVDQALIARANYRGSGSPVFYASVDVINSMLLARDKIGHRMYNTEAELASALRVSEVVEVPVLEGVTRKDSDDKEHKLLGLIVNLADYTVGTDRGGEITSFEGFDIDYNKHKYLIETRFSGALTKPFSAIALEADVAATSTKPETQPETQPVG